MVVSTRISTLLPLNRGTTYLLLPAGPGFPEFAHPAINPATASSSSFTGDIVENCENSAMRFLFMLMMKVKRRRGGHGSISTSTPFIRS